MRAKSVVPMISRDSSESELIRRYLENRMIGCPCCGYNLRGAPGSSCPECGSPLQLSLNSIDIRLGWWTVVFLSVAFPMGFALVLLGIGALGAWNSAFWSESDWLTLGGVTLLTGFYFVLLMRTMRRRGRFLRMSLIEQRIRAISMVALMIALQVLLMFSFKFFRY
jgi:hypothetical protein